VGQVDLTTNVDFGSLLRVLERQYADGVRAHGPVTQAEFLASMGIGERLGALIDQPDVTDQQAEVLFESFKRLVDDKQVCMPRPHSRRIHVQSLAPLFLRHRWEPNIKLWASRMQGRAMRSRAF
jgi:hypothetical protein